MIIIGFDRGELFLPLHLCQIILNATDRVTVCSVVAVHVGIAAVEVQVSGVSPGNRA